MRGHPDRSEAERPVVTGVRLNGAAHRVDLPLLVLGPEVGQGATEQWVATARGLVDAFDVFAWDLPGQGYNSGARLADFPDVVLDALAAAVLDLVDDVAEQRAGRGEGFAYAGAGVGADVGLRLARLAPGRLHDVLPLESAARPEDAARVIRARLLGETEPDRDPGARRTEAWVALEAAVGAARRAGIDGAEIDAAVRGWTRDESSAS